ncbi:MAG TPA: tol-pal system protein YbgF [Rhizomicrobium sp.]|nr:tol-pal system protein YbgF [Rhizomicrobium sp.]
MTKNTLRLAAAALALSLGVIPTLGNAADDATNAQPTAAERAHMNALAQQLGDDDAQAQPERTADLFGPSDDEKAAAAAAAQREQNQDANIATLNQRAGDLEDQIRKLTGEIEVLNHRLDELDQRIDRMKKDFDYKLCMMSAQQLGSTPGQPDAIPCGGAGASPQAMPPAQPQQGDAAPPTGVTHLAPPPGVLGTLSQQDAAAAPPPAQAPPQPAMQLAANDTHTQFEAAMNLLAKQQYDAASASLQTFVAANPKAPEAPDAYYWIGSVAYLQRDFPSAARAFAEVVKKYPTSPKGPESMLKLGQSFIAMNQKDEGCTALRALPQRYPTATRTVLAQAEAVRKAGGCRR